MLGALLIALVLLIAAPPAAEATFPGKNGDLVVTWHQWFHPVTYTDLLRISPSSGHETWIPVCAKLPSDDYPQPACVEGGKPAASPDGSSIAIATVDFSVDSGGFYHYAGSVRVLTLATGEWRQIHLADPSRVANTFEPLVRWAPGPAFLLAPSRGGAFSQDGLFLVGTDGATRGEPAPSGKQADVSASGRTVFVHNDNLQLLEPDGTTRPLTAKGGHHPSWSPHGKSIAFNRNGWIYTVSAAGGRAHRITRGAEPCWAPDGKLIAFFRPPPQSGRPKKAKNIYLYVVDRRTGHAHRVSPRVMANVNLETSALDGVDWLPAR